MGGMASASICWFNATFIIQKRGKTVTITARIALAYNSTLKPIARRRAFRAVNPGEGNVSVEETIGLVITNPLYANF